MTFDQDWRWQLQDRVRQLEEWRDRCVAEQPVNPYRDRLIFGRSLTELAQMPLEDFRVLVGVVEKVRV
jgi:hypothetical protein